MLKIIKLPDISAFRKNNNNSKIIKFNYDGNGNNDDKKS